MYSTGKSGSWYELIFMPGAYFLIWIKNGADVIDPVWSLLDETYPIHNVTPALLECDFNIPTLSKLMQEVKRIAQIQTQPIYIGYSHAHYNS